MPRELSRAERARFSNAGRRFRCLASCVGEPQGHRPGTARRSTAARTWSRAPAQRSAGSRPCRSGRARRSAAYAIGSLLMKGRLSHFLPAATMQLMPFGVVLTTVQVSFCVGGVDLEEIAVRLQPEGDRRLLVLAAQLLGDLGGVVAGHADAALVRLRRERGRERAAGNHQAGREKGHTTHRTISIGVGSPPATAMPFGHAVVTITLTSVSLIEPKVYNRPAPSARGSRRAGQTRAAQAAI